MTIQANPSVIQNFGGKDMSIIWKYLDKRSAAVDLMEAVRGIVL